MILAESQHDIAPVSEAVRLLIGALEDSLQKCSRASGPAPGHLPMPDALEQHSRQSLMAARSAGARRGPVGDAAGS